jgi:hypothetical protein
VHPPLAAQVCLYQISTKIFSNCFALQHKCERAASPAHHHHPLACKRERAVSLAPHHHQPTTHHPPPLPSRMQTRDGRVTGPSPPPAHHNPLATTTLSPPNPLATTTLSPPNPLATTTLSPPNPPATTAVSHANARGPRHWPLTITNPPPPPPANARWPRHQLLTITNPPPTTHHPPPPPSRMQTRGVTSPFFFIECKLLTTTRPRMLSRMQMRDGMFIKHSESEQARADASLAHNI